MSARRAKKKRPTKKKDLTTSIPLSAQRTDLLAGTGIAYNYSLTFTDSKSSAESVTPPKPTEKESLGLKHDVEKPSLAYIPKAALWAEGEAFKYGAKKYEAWNYRNGIALTRTLSAAIRHIVQFLDGENTDSESGVNHLGCARANLGMALDTLENHPEFDDRYMPKVTCKKHGETLCSKAGNCYACIEGNE